MSLLSMWGAVRRSIHRQGSPHGLPSVPRGTRAGVRPSVFQKDWQKWGEQESCRSRMKSYRHVPKMQACVLDGAML